MSTRFGRPTMDRERQTDMLVSWSDLGRPNRMGDYVFRDMLVRVDQDAISIWRVEPAAVFHVETQGPTCGTGVFVLGQWEMPCEPEEKN